MHLYVHAVVVAAPPSVRSGGLLNRGTFDAGVPVGALADEPSGRQTEILSSCVHVVDSRSTGHDVVARATLEGIVGRTAADGVVSRSAETELVACIRRTERPGP